MADDKKKPQEEDIIKEVVEKETKPTKYRNKRARISRVLSFEGGNFISN